MTDNPGLEYVNVKILEIIIKGIAQFRPQLLADGTLVKSLPRHADKVRVGVKKDVLDAVLADGGAQLVLKLATALESELATSPLLFFLLNSAAPEDLVRKLEQYDRYFHSGRQVRFVASGTGYLTVEHISRSGSSIAASEDIFVCGLLKFLLAQLGCRGLHVAWLQVNDPRTRDYLDPETAPPLPAANQCRWRFSWEAFDGGKSISGLDGFLLGSVQPLSVDGGNALSDSLLQLVVTDLSRKWELADLADLLNMSKRTLQRRLKQEGVSFSRLLAGVRIEHSLALVKNSNLPLADIGYLLGFSDSAHFSREFKKARGMTPLAYRRQAHRRQPPATPVAGQPAVRR